MIEGIAEFNSFPQVKMKVEMKDYYPKIGEENVLISNDRRVISQM